MTTWTLQKIHYFMVNSVTLGHCFVCNIDFCDLLGETGGGCHKRIVLTASLSPIRDDIIIR